MMDDDDSMLADDALLKCNADNDFSPHGLTDVAGGTCGAHPRTFVPMMAERPPPQHELAEKYNSISGEPLAVVSAGTNRSAPDSLSQKGAMALAKRLESYWHERGYPAARFWAVLIDERFQKVGTYEIYRVACNLVNGLPPRYRE